MLNTRSIFFGGALVAAIFFLNACGGPAAVEVAGELKQWHKVTLTVDGPMASETDADPNPFTDYRMTVTFAHESGSPTYEVPGYFAADGNAGETSADSGNKWRAHLSPDKAGRWTYTIAFVEGDGVALDLAAAGSAVSPANGAAGEFEVGPTDKSAPDFRALGRLTYVGKHHLQFAGSGDYFLKAGADSPETFLAYTDFDSTEARKQNVPLKTWEPHVRDWREGDPTWKDGKGKGMIGALNYLADEGLNAFSFLTYNAGGDGDNIWPFVSRDDKMHYDASKLDQWGVVFDHAQSRGLYLHFKLQENEIDDNRRGDEREITDVPEALDNGALGPERRLYVRELIARYGHALALNWNLGEENTQTTQELLEMSQFIVEVDPYDHHTVVHTFPGDQDQVYQPLLGPDNAFTGVSLQNSWDAAHQRTLKWIRLSAAAGKPWVVANDEQNSASHGAPPDTGYEGYEGKDNEGVTVQTVDDIRRYTLWGNLMAGGAGVEYYFGYRLPQNDLIAEDYRSRDKSWDYCRIALDFFRQLPLAEMSNANALIGNSADDNSKYALAKAGEVYLVYLPECGTTRIDLTDAEGEFSVQWLTPRDGGTSAAGSVESVTGGRSVSLGQAPADRNQDWAVLLRKQ